MVLPVLLSAVLLVGCASEPAPVAAPPPSPSSSPSPSPSPAPKPKPAPTTDPLTGRPGVPTGSVVAVKIDNSPLARPYHRGMGAASVVYQEVMEGGASRFLAVYAPATAIEVGPVRSVREGDIELLRQYGKVALGSSGGNSGVLATVAAAAKAGQLLDATYDVVPGPYRKAERRRDAINFFTSPAKIDQARPAGSKVRDIGMRFGGLAPGAGASAAAASISFSRITRVRVQYEPAAGSYAVFQDGDRMRDFAPTNVVVQSAKVAESQYVDVLGNRTPYTSTLGTGHVDVLRDGRRLSGTWLRKGPNVGTRFLDPAGRDLPLKPGSTLVLLAPSDRPLVVG